MHAIRHLLTPGTPVYGLLKLAAVGLLVVLYMTRARSGGGQLFGTRGGRRLRRQSRRSRTR